MLKTTITNKEAIDSFNRLPEKSRHEIKLNWANRVGVTDRTFSNRIAKGDFSLEERKVFDELCNEQFAIMPELLEELVEQ